MYISDAEEKRKKIRKRIQDFRLFDDEFMSKCFEDNIECTELVLRIIMDKSDLKVKKAHVQHVISNLQGRSITLDIEAVDSEQKEYDIEIQRADRVRYFKEDEEGVNTMSGIVEELMEEFIDDEKKESALRMLRGGKLSNEEIAEYSGLDIKVVNALEKEQKAIAY